ncbi:MAG: VOC family protein [Actinomycetota bacterium]
MFEQLDFLYIPSTDVAADAAYFTEVLGGRLAFAIDGDGARVAMVEMTEGPPALLLTDHLDGDRTIFIFRVTNLRRALKELADRGWEREETFEIPQGPCCSFVTPKGQRVALYERTRPDVESHFVGRKDF